MLIQLASFCVALLVAFQGIPSGLMRPEYTAPQKPFTIAGNLHFVGSQGLGVYLITSPQGHILINSSYEANVPVILGSHDEVDRIVGYHADPSENVSWQLFKTRSLFVQPQA